MVSDLEVAKKIVQISSSANSRGIDFDLSFKATKKLLTQKRCFFTNVEFDPIHNSPNCRTFDRLDNSLGYIDSNLVACTKNINSLKGKLTIDEIKMLIKGLKKKKLI